MEDLQDYIKKLKEKFSAMTYNELRKLAKEYSISGKQKKAEIMDELVEKMTHQMMDVDEFSAAAKSSNEQDEGGHQQQALPEEQPLDEDGIENEENKDEERPPTTIDMYEIDERLAPARSPLLMLKTEEAENNSIPMDSPDSLRLSISSSDTYIKTEATIIGAEKEIKDISGAAINLPAADEIHSDDNNVATEDLAESCRKIQDNMIECNHPSPSGNAGSSYPPLSPAPSKSYSRFARQHEKMMDAMPSISEAHARLLKRHEENTNVPEHVKRLVSPRPVKTQTKEKMVNSGDVNSATSARYRFGDGLPTGAVATFSDNTTKSPAVSNAGTSASGSKRFTIRSSFTTPKMGVKELTKLKSSSTPTPGTPTVRMNVLWSSRLNTVDLGGSEGKSIYNYAEVKPNNYVPKRGRYSYVDTTKMSDKEFAQYQEAKKNAHGK